MSSSSESIDIDSDEETVSSVEIGDFKDDSGSWSDEVLTTSSEEEEEESSSEEEDEEESSSEEDDDSSTEVTSDSSSFNNKKGKATHETISSSSSGSFASESDESSEDSDSDSDSEARLKSAMKKPVAKATRKTAEIAPPGISRQAYKMFLSKPIEVSPEKQSTNVISNEPSLAHSKLMIQHVEDEMKRRRNDLSSSQHSRKSCEDIIDRMNKDLLGIMDDIDDKMVEDISIEDESKKYKDMPDKTRPRSEMALLRDKREMRLAKVRERIRAKEQAKEREVDKKKMHEFENKINGGSGFDMSENARRERAYGWYTRMAMPSKDEMKQRVAGMPSSSGVSVEDVDLLPWSVSNRMVNVAKMQKFINEGFKKRIAPRRTQKPDSDSDSS